MHANITESLYKGNYKGINLLNNPVNEIIFYLFMKT